MNENVEIEELTMDQLSEVSAGGPMNGTGGGGATGTGPGTGGGDGLGHLRALLSLVSALGGPGPVVPGGPL